MVLTGKYIYCFIKEKNEITIGSSFIANITSPVYTLPFGDISAVVSNTNIFEYDPTRKNLTAHQKVITKIMEKYTIIPVAFGTVSNNRKDIFQMLSDNYDLFNEELTYFTNKSEVGLRITWDKDYFNEDIEDDDIKELKEKVSGKDENEVLVDKVQLGKLVEAAIEQRREEYTEKIYLPLSKIAVESKLKDNIPIKTIFNSYFLIDNSKSEEFDKLVEELAKPYENKLVFSYTGPWPPYNFVNIKLNINTNAHEEFN